MSGSSWTCGEVPWRRVHALEPLGAAFVCLILRLESWRHDPDLCLIWAAFCTTSPLTLADGISLAKTRRPGQVTLDNSCLAFYSRSATEALKLLAGAETGKDHNGRPLPEANQLQASCQE